MSTELKYTQEDMDNITSKVKEAQLAKIEKNYISLEEYNKVQKELNDLKASNNKQAFKETFKANGGNLDAFDDFVSNNQDILGLEQDKQVSRLNELKETKKFYFNDTTPSGISKPLPNDEDVFKALNNKGNDDLYPGTIYKIK